MSAPDPTPEVTTTAKGSDLVDKGLAEGSVGTFAGAVLGKIALDPTNPNLVSTTPLLAAHLGTDDGETDFSFG